MFEGVQRAQLKCMACNHVSGPPKEPFRTLLVQVKGHPNMAHTLAKDVFRFGNQETHSLAAICRILIRLMVHNGGGAVITTLNFWRVSLGPLRFVWDLLQTSLLNSARSVGAPNIPLYVYTHPTGGIRKFGIRK